MQKNKSRTHSKKQQMNEVKLVTTSYNLFEITSHNTEMAPEKLQELLNAASQPGKYLLESNYFIFSFT